jgi:tetrapyrrole methylase family protein / MazG family protein
MQGRKLPLYEIDRRAEIDLRTVLYVPPLGENTAFEGFQEVVARLRAPDGCPWDRKQTHSSLKRYLLEEAYELLDALDREDPVSIAEELGDLLLQILLHTQIGVEEGEFGMVDVLSGIHDKIVRRHPHIFAGTTVEGAEGVITAWENIKAQERLEKGNAEGSVGMLEGVPQALPALTQAQEIQERAARVGFDWADIVPVYGKVEEELREVREAAGTDQVAGEIGDLLFAVVNLSRWLGVDAEAALRSSGKSFRRRFRYIEEQVSASGKKLQELTLSELDVYWDEAKRKE